MDRWCVTHSLGPRWFARALAPETLHWCVIGPARSEVGAYPCNVLTPIPSLLAMIACTAEMLAAAVV
ncbi:hypothetical protein DEA8626_03981 [Defluviimonas aquaemixtae]|uniref:Uncharacterized protein n=1 Tax=Albidovulum aquaemixtae TaxID=1542388 RepID=A0A2R8BNE0_9RHOB|nr:hypothetical protein DEA8626_03981 [Defluviimonas aquaemixtae]